MRYTSNPNPLATYDCMVLVEFYESQIMQSDLSNPGAYEFALLEPMKHQQAISQEIINSIKEIPLYVAQSRTSSK